MELVDFITAHHEKLNFKKIEFYLGMRSLYDDTVFVEFHPHNRGKNITHICFYGDGTYGIHDDKVETNYIERNIDADFPIELCYQI